MKISNKIAHTVFLFLISVMPVISQASNKKPNILIIVSDDQGNADAGYQRNPPQVSTPAIDELAQAGVVFTNGYASANVCAPTRAGLLTGRYQQRYGFYRAPDSRRGLPLSEITLAEVLKKEGYSTGAFGKWHLGLTEEYHPCNRGFDEFYGFLGHGGHDYFDLTIPLDAKNLHNSIYRNFSKVSDEGYLTDRLAEEASTFIRNNSEKGNPFFLYLPFNAVHSPLQAPEKDVKKFNTGDRDRDILLAMIRRMDIAIAEVIKTLKKEGVYENTIIFFFSDNGGAKATKANNLPLRGFKHSLYEGGLRVPFIMCWPGKISPSVCNEPVISLDIMPTICAALQIDLPADRKYDGKNILPALQPGFKGPLHEHLFFDVNDDSWAVREGDMKLLFPSEGAIELYNLNDDISEQNNIANQNSDIVTKLMKKYALWRSEMGVPMSKKE